MPSANFIEIESDPLFHAETHFITLRLKAEVVVMS